MDRGTNRSGKNPSPTSRGSTSLRHPSRPCPAGFAQRYSPPENRARSKMIVSVVALIVGGLFIFLSFGMA
jgi:hypothetical protein